MPKHIRKKTPRGKSRRAHKTRRGKTVRRLKGGNYAKDITKGEIDGVPVTKDAVVTVPGVGTMDGSAYRQYKEDLDRNGKTVYD